MAVHARGSHTIRCCRDNLVTACEMCNSQKGNSSLKQMGWKLKQIPKVSQAVRWQQLGDAAPHSPEHREPQYKALLRTQQCTCISLVPLKAAFAEVASAERCA